jgi:hypothetical protein
MKKPDLFTLDAVITVVLTFIGTLVALGAAYYLLR